MAGAGYKLFNTGDVLTAAQVNTYLNEQTVMVFASSAARTSALSGVLAEGMMSYLQDTNAVEVYNGSSWVNVGNAGDITEVQAGVGISIASGTGPIPVITNSSTDLITTAGDILYGTAADTVARLGIGTAGQVLKVNSGATAPEWGAPVDKNGLVFISRTAFSNVASQAFDGVFTSTYQKYYIALDNVFAVTSTDDLQIQFRYAGPTTETANYYGFMNTTGFNANIATTQQSNTNQITIHDNSGSSSAVGGGYLYIANVGNTSQNASLTANFFEMAGSRGSTSMGGPNNARTYTGFLLKSSSSNIYGTVTIYGLANS